VADWVAQQPANGRIRSSLPPQLLARVEPDHLQVMVSNLLDNALGYSPPGSTVHVTLQEACATNIRPHHLALTVRNAPGKAGLPDAQRVFDKYYRAEGAHLRTGSGLGLYLVKSLAEQANGGIAHRVDTAPDGTPEAVFELWVPCR